MENITRALILAASMMLFVIGFAYSMYLVNHLMTTSEVLLDTVSTTNYYDNLEVSHGNDRREVGVDTIVSTLYRYYKERYAVKIYDDYDDDGEVELIQVFDLKLENEIYTASRAGALDKVITHASSDKDKKIAQLSKSIYNTPSNSAYLFGAPWMGNSNEYTLARIDYFLHGTTGYINDTLVEYGKTIEKDGKIGFLNIYSGDTFYEEFDEYAYTGETISTANGLETITGNTQEETKIIITYTKK